MKQDKKQARVYDSETVRTIALILNDNDFGGTFNNLLNSIYQAIIWNGGLSREVITAAVMSGIEFHYTAFQHGKTFGNSGYGTIEGTVEYLKKVKVLFNEEAEADAAQGYHDGGAWYLDVQSGIVSAY